MRSTYVVDNIDWKNKDVKETGTHHTNPIVIQPYTVDENGTNVATMESDYN